MDSNPYRSRLNGLDWSATPIQSSHSIANTGFTRAGPGVEDR